MEAGGRWHQRDGCTGPAAPGSEVELEGRWDERHRVLEVMLSLGHLRDVTEERPSSYQTALCEPAGDPQRTTCREGEPCPKAWPSRQLKGTVLGATGEANNVHSCHPICSCEMP